METFIVLGLCFILYEALDLFQSCYNHNNRHSHHHFGEHLEGATDENKDTARLILDTIQEVEIGDDSDNSTHLDNSKVFSISENLDSQKLIKEWIMKNNWKKLDWIKCLLVLTISIIQVFSRISRIFVDEIIYLNFP